MIPASIFIGSSSEGKRIAEEIKIHFSDFETVRIWDENVFQLNMSYLDSLNHAANLYDYAIMCLTPDDITLSRGNETSSPRNNVLFELGLFMGRQGQQRAFIIAEESVNILSDFHGISIAKYRQPQDGNLSSAVRNACTVVRRAIESDLKVASPGFLPSTALAFGYYENFVAKVVKVLTDDEPDLIDLGDGTMPLPLKFEEFNFKILLPNNLGILDESNDIKIKLRQQYKNPKQVQIKTSYRNFPFMVTADFTQIGSAEKPQLFTEKLQLFDVPITLRSSRQIIDFISGIRGFGDREEDRNRSENREIKNFKKALEYLIRRGAKTDYVSVEWL
ncbi:MAG: nucleotide-binding protein [Chloroflexi bacterium]|nr:nucleotide-binding protein [Chloroflexota bacterium]